MLHPKADYKLNYIIDFMFDICDAPLSVWIRTLWPALLEALIAYYALDMTQIFTRYVKPPGIYKGKRGGNHGAGNRKQGGKRTFARAWGVVKNFDPNNSAADLMPNDGFDTHRSITPGVRTLWQLYDVEQRVLYWIMVYEITEQFWYRWSSGVAESYYCKAQYRPMAYGTCGFEGNLPVLELTPVVCEEIIKARHGASIIGNVARAPGQGSQIFFSGTGYSPTDEPWPAGCKLVVIHSSGVRIESGDIAGAGHAAAVSGGVTAEGYWACYTTGPSLYTLSDVTITVLGNENYIGN